MRGRVKACSCNGRVEDPTRCTVPAPRLGQVPERKGLFPFQHAGNCFCFNAEAWKFSVVVSVSEELEAQHSLL